MVRLVTQCRFGLLPFAVSELHSFYTDGFKFSHSEQMGPK
uniref:Uncharacterized protein n=1 Tax=Anguilla anguilla TaxID=7936 RepID=A0A0E9VJD8_ANGAN